MQNTMQFDIFCIQKVLPGDYQKRRAHASKPESEENSPHNENLLVFSIVVLMKGEEKSCSRLLDALSKLNNSVRT